MHISVIIIFLSLFVNGSDQVGKVCRKDTCNCFSPVICHYEAVTMFGCTNHELRQGYYHSCQLDCVLLLLDLSGYRIGVCTGLCLIACHLGDNHLFHSPPQMYMPGAYNKKVVCFYGYVTYFTKSETFKLTFYHFPFFLSCLYFIFAIASIHIQKKIPKPQLV